MYPPVADIHIPFQKRTQIIYLTSLLLIVAALFALPYLNLDVTVRAQASIRPASELSIIRSLASGRLKEVYAVENKLVQKGDPLFVIDSEILEEQARFNQEKLINIASLAQDAETAIQTISFPTENTQPTFNTSYYHQQYQAFSQKLAEATNQYDKVRRIYDRQSKLFQNRVIPLAEFENNQFELRQAAHTIQEVRQNHQSRWQGELKTYTEEKKEVESLLENIQKEKKAFLIKAPITGTIQNLTGLYSGSTVSINQELVQLSPDTTLTAVAYIKPNDIGLLREGMLVRFQVDAFNFHQWGMATGRILSLPEDIKVINDQPFFEVRCALDKEFLQLKSGYKGFLKKGMTLQARFIVTNRTAWQLLYDNISDWMNPYINQVQ